MAQVYTIDTLDFEGINRKIASGCKFRIDVGTSVSAPVSKYWFDNCVQDMVVVGIEPNPDCWDKQNIWDGRVWNIQTELQKFANYYHVIGACSNVETKVRAPFHLIGGNVGCSSLLTPKMNTLAGCYYDKAIEVDVFALKDITSKISCQLIELIKMDTQGNDLNVLKSLGGDIHRVAFIDVESDATYYYENACNYSDLKQYMQEMEFDLYEETGGNSRFRNKQVSSFVGYYNTTGNM